MTADIWVAMIIAVFGSSVVLYYSREAKNEFRSVRIFTRVLTGLMAVLFAMCIILVLNV
jgi:predicted membrane channel-forming protein YqfA (hemolysin III family)